jgi:tetratricopeptide (TPR) repeat protein
VDVLTRGQNALEKEDFAEARKCFEAARTLDPNNKVVTEWLVKVEFATLVHSGRVAIKLGQYRQAIDYLEQALKLRSDDKAVVILLQKAKEEELRVAYKAAMQRGRDYWAGKRLPEAKKAFGDALVLKPGDVEAQRFLEQVEKAFADPNGKKPSSPKGGDALVAVLAADSSRLDNEDFVKQLELLQAEQGKRLVHGGPCLLTKKGLVPWQRSVKPPSEDLFRSAEYEKLFAKAFEEVKNLEAQVENKTFRTVFIWETNYNPKFGNKDVKVPQERRMRLCYWLYQSSEESERLEGWFGGRQYARRVPKVSQLKEWVEALLRK